MQNWTKALVQNAAVRDEYYDNVVSLLHFDGTDGSTTFDDEKGKIWTPTGAVELDTSVKQFGSASGSFNGGYLSSPNSVDWDIGSGNYTIEAWIRVSGGSGSRAILSKRTTSSSTYAPFLLFIESGGTLRLAQSTNGTTWGVDVVSVTSLSLGIFYHIAAVRTPTLIALYVNGVMEDSQVSGAGIIMTNTAAVTIGAGAANGDQSFIGNIDDFRFTKGIARYTSNFTPPTKTFPDR
jgi:hypothetical protein